MVNERYPRRDAGGRHATPTSSANINGEQEPYGERGAHLSSVIASSSRRSTRSSRRGGDDHHSEQDDHSPQIDDEKVPVRSKRRSFSPHTNMNGTIPKEYADEPPRRRTRRNHDDDCDQNLMGTHDRDVEAEAGADTNRRFKREDKEYSESNGGRRTTRRTRSQIHEHDEEEEEQPMSHHEEQRRSSRQRKSRYHSYKETDITPYRWRRGSRSNGIDSPSADQEHEEEGEAVENGDNMDMYTRVKRQRRKIKRDMYGMPLVDQEEEKSTEDEEETEEEEEEDGEEEEEEEEENEEEATAGQYNLRQNKPRTKRYQAPIVKKAAHNYFKETPPKRKYKERSEIKFKSPAHRRRNKHRRAQHRTSSTSSSGSESEDERRFARRKGKSMAKARQRCLPMNLAQNELTHVMKDRQKIGASLADIDPMSLDKSVTFDSIGGLTDHLQALKEMIVFPLLYPEVFERFKIAPPRGVLFHGPPGTGKTLVARALANECSTGEKKVAFFMRKGADCLSKWVGESERQLRLLFDQAYQVRPSIIFFDEIDGLAPVRSSRQDQIHSSIVSTLLALMDGLDGRGEVVVIGATNRIDSIDPALRRPGRFDREFLFNLPPVEARADILRIHTREWNPKLLDSFIHEVASKCNGYCGADMKALCTEAALHALRRRYPQIYTSTDKLELDVTTIDISAGDFHYAMNKIVPAGQRAVVAPGRPLSVIIKPLLYRQLQSLITTLSSSFPFLANISSTAGVQHVSTMSSMTASLLDAVDDEPNAPPVTESAKTAKRKSKQGANDTNLYQGPFLNFNISATSRPIVSRPRILLYGDPTQGHTTHLAPALLHCMEKLPVHVLDLPTLYANSARTPEESCSQVFREARRATPSIIYIPHIDQWWQVLSDTMRATFLMMLSDLDPLMSLLLLATSDSSAHMLPLEIRHLFSLHTSEQYQVTKPVQSEIREFFEDLIMKQTCVPPPTKKQAARNLMEVLPKAAVPSKPAALTEVEEKSLWDQEEAVLRELRLFLRDMLNKLARDRKFNIFAKPVDDEEVPDYSEIIKEPMDLSTMMSKIDLHKYQACKEFLDDIDLICANALEYNPATSIAGRAIRHRACALKDMAHALIDAELDESFEKQCREILESRRNRGKSPSKSAPKYYHTKPLNGSNTVTASSSMHPVRYSRRLKHEDAQESLMALETRQLLEQAQPYSDAMKELMSTRQTRRVSHDITQDDHPSPIKKKRKKKSRWSLGIAPPRKSVRRHSVHEDLQEESEPEEDSANIDESDNKASTEVDTDKNTQQTDITTELPVGDVTQAKLDLTDKFEGCDSIIPTEATNTASTKEFDNTPTESIAHETVNKTESTAMEIEEEDKNPQTNGGMEHRQRDSGYNSIETSNDASNGATDYTQGAEEVMEMKPSSSETAEPTSAGAVSEMNGDLKKTPVVRDNVKDEGAVAEEAPAGNDIQNVTAAEAPAEATPEKSSRSTAAHIAQSPLIHEKVLEIEPVSSKRKTRSMSQDPHVIACMDILEESLPSFFIDTDKLPALLDKAVHIGCMCTLTQLEKLYSLIAQRIYHHRGSYNRAEMLQEIDQLLDNYNYS